MEHILCVKKKNYFPSKWKAVRHIFVPFSTYLGLPWLLSGKESACQCKRPWSNPWVRKMSWGRKGQPTPVCLPGKCHGQRSLVGYSPWDCKRIGHNLVIKQLILTLSLNKEQINQDLNFFLLFSYPSFVST